MYKKEIQQSILQNDADKAYADAFERLKCFSSKSFSIFVTYCATLNNSVESLKYTPC